MDLPKNEGNGRPPTVLIASSLGGNSGGNSSSNGGINGTNGRSGGKDTVTKVVLGETAINENRKGTTHRDVENGRKRLTVRIYHANVAGAGGRDA